MLCVGTAGVISQIVKVRRLPVINGQRLVGGGRACLPVDSCPDRGGQGALSADLRAEVGGAGVQGCSSGAAVVMTDVRAVVGGAEQRSVVSMRYGNSTLTDESHHSADLRREAMGAAVVPPLSGCSAEWLSRLAALPSQKGILYLYICSDAHRHTSGRGTLFTAHCLKHTWALLNTSSSLLSNQQPSPSAT